MAKRRRVEPTEQSPFEIDQYALDKEWLKQPKLMMEYGQRLADARREVDELKAELELCCSEADKDIRSDPESFQLEKVTEKAVEATVPLHPKVAKARQSLIEAKHGADVLQAAVNALEHRKRALESLVQLYGMEYYSEPRASGEDADALRDAQKRSARRGIKGH